MKPIPIQYSRMTTSTKPLAELVYIQAISIEIEKRITNKYRKRIDHLVNANNELMKELEIMNKENSNSLSTEESQIVMMPWLKEHIKE